MSSHCIDVDSLLLSPEYVESPYAIFDLLREDYPVYWSDDWNAWLITRYDDAQYVFRNFKSFSNRGRYTEYLSSLPVEQIGQLQYLQHHYEHGGLVQSDPPDHTRLRKLVGSAFTPRMVNRMQDLVQQIVNDLLADFESKEDVELIYEYAFALPATVIAGMLGVPADQRDQFKDWSATIQRFLGAGKVSFEYAIAAQDAWKRMNGFFGELLTARREHPEVDLLSNLAQACEDGQRLTEEEVIRTCGALLIAGHETTTNLISNAIWLLLRHPEQLRELKEDSSLYPSAIEEFLRYETPFQYIPRTVVTDIELHGKTLRKGQLAYVMLGAVNRDPEQFEDPHRLNLRRENNKHLAFGYGVHFCLGAPLARMEAPIAIQSLLERFPRLSLDPQRPPVWKQSMGQRGMESFRLRLR